MAGGIVMPVMLREPEAVSDEKSKPLPGYRVSGGEDLNVYFLIEQTGPGPTTWTSAAVTYRQGWRIPRDPMDLDS